MAGPGDEAMKDIVNLLLLLGGIALAAWIAQTIPRRVRWLRPAALKRAVFPLLGFGLVAWLLNWDGLALLSAILLSFGGLWLWLVEGGDLDDSDDDDDGDVGFDGGGGLG